jgi:hypothetical protein
MPLFGRKRASLEQEWCLSADVEEDEEGGWRVTWFGDSKGLPRQSEGATLTEATDTAATAALAVYSLGPQPPGAVLGFAIYPRTSGKNGALYDVSGCPGQFAAREMAGSDREVQAASLEDLVVAVRRQAGDEIAMLRWVRPFSELPAEPLTG